MRTLPTSVGAATALALDTIILILVARYVRITREVFDRNRVGKTELTARAATLMPVSGVTGLAGYCPGRRRRTGCNSRTLLLTDDEYIGCTRIMVRVCLYDKS